MAKHIRKRAVASRLVFESDSLINHKAKRSNIIPKRHGNLYPKIYQYDNLCSAHKNARKGKRHYREVKEINGRESYYLRELQRRLQNKSYETSEYEVYIKNDSGKEREIYKLPFFPDRIAQWAILQVIEPILIKKTIYNTYSAIPNRGIHTGVKSLRKDLKSNSGTKYCLKMDIKKYYPSINQDILTKKVYPHIFKDPDLLWILTEISTSTKSGIPIGNYLSQWSGNIYLNRFDHWCKEQKSLRVYHRYMDDIVILHNSKRFLHNLFEEIEDYLWETRKLKIKGNYQVFPVESRGIDFLGYRFFNDYTLLRKDIAKKFKRKMRKIAKKDKLDFHDYTSINSYLGWLKWCDSYNLKQKYIKPLKPMMEEYERRNDIDTV